MKKIIITICAFVCVLAGYAQQGSRPQIIPEPREIIMSDGGFSLNTSTTVAIQEEMAEAGKYLIEQFGSRFGLELKTAGKKPKKNRIILKKEEGMNAGAYRIAVDTKGVICEASTEEGMFYAVQSLLQSVQTWDGIRFIYSMTINDAPRFGWRGIMLDVSRHFFDKQTIMNLLDVMAYLKMNRFHMHLSDEDGWRVEIRKYPKLTEEGAKGNWHDRSAPRKFFTQEDIREIVAYAAQRHIMVIPEIDMPGHATAAARAYPEVSAGGTGRWKGFTFNPAKEYTYKFLDDVLSEIAELFPAPYIHIGGDEVHYGNQVWFTDPDIQSFIKRNGLGNEVGLEHYFLRRVCDIIAGKGKKMIGWDEVIASGVTPDKAAVMWWRHDKPEQLTTALEKGFDVVMCPRLPCYFDFVQHDSHKIGRRWFGKFNTLENTYKFPDDRAELFNGYENRILGLQSCMWSERVVDVKRLWFMLFPRLAAIAEDGWSMSEVKEYECFEKRIGGFLKYLNKLGINYFNPFNPESTPEPWGPEKADVIAEG